MEIIRRMHEEDIKPVSEIAEKCFSGLKEGALEWIRCNFNAFPRM